jgi:DNA-binding transcriptional regulator YdaS (Cro superfamily)
MDYVLPLTGRFKMLASPFWLWALRIVRPGLLWERSGDEGSFRNLLTRYARGFYDLLSQSPATISMICSGRAAVSPKGTKFVEQVIRSGVECGLKPAQAYGIFRQVSAAAVGAAAVEAADSATKNPVESIWKQFGRHIGENDEPWYLDSIAPALDQTEEFENFSTVLVTLDGLLERAGVI